MQICIELSLQIGASFLEGSDNLRPFQGGVSGSRVAGDGHVCANRTCMPCPLAVSLIRLMWQRGPSSRTFTLQFISLQFNC